MKRHIDIEIKFVKEKLLHMSSLVQESISNALNGLLNQDFTEFEKVAPLEEKINHLHLEVDDCCIKILATHSPLAKDLRLTLAIVKMNHELERMGDHATTITYNAKDYLKNMVGEKFDEIKSMADLSKKMILDSMQSFVNRDIELAKAVLTNDDVLDEQRDRLIAKWVRAMSQDSTHIESYLYLIFITKTLERIGDHSTNIAEDVIFINTGKDVRHHNDQV